MVSKTAQERRQQALLAQQQAERRRQRRILALVAVGVVVLVVVAGIGVQAFRSFRAPSADGNAAPAAGFAAVQVSEGQPLRLGRPDSPVTLELFSDFHCPHCAEFEETFGPTIRDLQNQGTLTLALYPMAFIDAGSRAASNAMACAAEAGAGPAYSDGLFANHRLQWSGRQLNELADRVGIPRGSISGCVAEQRHQGWVDSINQTAAAKGVTGTPTLFLAGQKLPVESLTTEQFSAAVQRAADTAG